MKLLRTFGFYALVLAAALVIGLWLAFDFASFLFLAAAVLLLVSLKNNFAPEQRSFLTKVLFIVFAVKIALATAYYFLSQHMGMSIDFFGDARGYSHNGFYIAYVLNNKSLAGLAPRSLMNDHNLIETVRGLSVMWQGYLPRWYSYRMGGFSYAIGFLYFLFGYSPLTIKFFNVFLSCLTGVFLYRITQRCGTAKTARASFLLYILFPSLFLWSLTGLKDTLIIFFLVLFVYLLLRFDESPSLRLLCGITATIVLMYFFNYKKFNIPIFTIAACFFLYRFLRGALGRPSTAVFAFFALACLLLGAMAFVPDKVFALIGQFDPARFISTQIGFVTTGGEVFKIYPQKCYQGNYNLTFLEMLVSYARGLAYFFFSPFPLYVRTFGQLLVLPQLLLWYGMLPFIGIGACALFRRKKTRFFILGGFLFVFVSMFSLVEGNIGTLFRHRDWMVPFFIIFVSVGIDEVRRRGEENA